MSVDFESVAARCRCDASSLKLAAPLLEQGFTPPFLARYRRDELGGVDENSLWALMAALRTQAEVDQKQQALEASWQETELKDPSLGVAIRKANSARMLQRVSRRLSGEAEQVDDATKLAVRVLNPQKGDPSDVAELAQQVEGIGDVNAAIEGLDAAVASRLAGDPRIVGSAVRWLTKNAKIKIERISDPHGEPEPEKPKKKRKRKDRSGPKPDAKAAGEAAGKTTEKAVQAAQAVGVAGDVDAATAAATVAEKTKAATELVEKAGELAPEKVNEKVAEIGDAVVQKAAEVTDKASGLADKVVDKVEKASGIVATISDVIDAAGEALKAPADPPQDGQGGEQAPSDSAAQENQSQEEEEKPVESTDTASSPTPVASESTGESATDAASTADVSEASKQTASDSPAGDPPADETSGTEASASKPAGSNETSSAADAKATASPPVKPSTQKPSGPKMEVPPAEPPPKPKKMSPRQRRRKWLVSVLKSLSGKKFDAGKLSSFHIVMLARALRSQVAQCRFEYDATRMVAELQHAAGNINREHSDYLRRIVLEHEATIRDAAESAWWEDLQERSSVQLVSISADQLRTQMTRGGVEAQCVLAIDAVGPRTAASSIVSGDGRVLHTEDLPCGLGKGPRTAAVARIGELIHAHHVDLIVISNGPARRGVMIALSELVAQSQPGSIRFTLCERSGADAYSGSSVADSEMKATPRRFRAAAWLAFSILHPAQALAKVDPLKLRLNSFTRELSTDSLRTALSEIIQSGASRGGVDVNGAPKSWLARLPGMDMQTAGEIDKARRESLFPSRQALVDGGYFDGSPSKRQALPFLRVFNSEQVLDGTLIHPDDYRIAERLLSSLEIEPPPPAPPGYVTPVYENASGDDDVDRSTKLVDASEGPAKAVVEDFTGAGEKSKEFSVEDAVTTEADAQSGEEPATRGAPETQAETAEASIAEKSPEQSSAGETATAESASEQADAEPTAAGGGDDTKAPDAASDSDSADSGESLESKPGDSTPPPPVIEVVRRPMPEAAKIDKLVKEWQIGAKRAHQIVSWLCDPFGDGDVSGSPPGVMTAIPSMKTLRPGDQVVGVVVGLMPFGVFVELAPDCSGLVHISKLSEDYIDDLNEAVSIGDIVTAYVTGTDDKHRRVSLSLVSPQREAELAERRRNDRGGYRGGGRGNDRGDGQRGGNRGAASGGGNRDAGRGGNSRGGGGGQGGRGGGQGGRGGQGARGNRGGQGGGGRSRDGQRGGGRRSRQPESYRVESKVEVKPLTDGMKQGSEPMRSFGDLAQFVKPESSSGAASSPAPKPTDVASANSPAGDASSTPVAPTSNQASAADSGPTAAETKSSNDSDATQAAKSPANSDAAGGEAS